LHDGNLSIKATVYEGNVQQYISIMVEFVSRNLLGAISNYYYLKYADQLIPIIRVNFMTG